MTDTALAFVITGGMAAFLFCICLLYKLHTDRGTYTTDLRLCEHCCYAVPSAGSIVCAAYGQRIIIKLRKCPDYSRIKKKRRATGRI